MGRKKLLGSLSVLAVLTAGGASAAPAIPVSPPPVHAAPGAAKADPAAWQTVIDGQIAAFRLADAAKAMGYAGASFKARFKDPMAFMTAIAAAGYAPIFTSVSDSFGKYEQPDPKSVLQEVDFVGPDQKLFVAVYALGQEPDGWRVEGVELAQTPGMGV